MLLSALQLIVVTCRLVFFHYSLLLLNDLNILYTFDKLAEVYRFKSSSFSRAGSLELSNKAAHPQCWGHGSSSRVAVSHCPGGQPCLVGTAPTSHNSMEALPQQQMPIQVVVLARSS